jgi:hypothetical protein
MLQFIFRLELAWEVKTRRAAKPTLLGAKIFFRRFGSARLMMFRKIGDVEGKAALP